MAKVLKYDESSIRTHSVMEGIRAKPGMYIGNPDSYGIWHLAKEAADNSVDEFNAGRNKMVHIIYADDGSIWVIDAGAGIPVGKHPKTKVSTLTTVLTSLHAGGKFDDKAYAHSIGTHGVGMKATNALSKEFQVWTCRDGQWWTTKFAKGVQINKDAPVVKTNAPKLPHKLPMPKLGTVVRYIPDETIFHKGSKFQIKHAEEWAELTSYLNAGILVKVTNQKGDTKEWQHKNGIADYIAHKAEELKANTDGKMFHLMTPEVDVALQVSDCDGVEVEAYTNSSRNVDGGVHLNALFQAFSKALEPYRGKKDDYAAADIREGLIGVINYKISSPQFSSQTKEKLVDERVKKPCYDQCLAALEEFFSANKTLAKSIIARAAELKKAKDEFANNKKVLKELGGAKKTRTLLPGKFSGANNCQNNERECYLVEGDSAGGTAKFARDKNYQEILPLKGKILNVMKAKEGQAFDSEEVMNILKVIGYDPSQKSPLDHLRIGKLIFLCDPDVDGYHINVLLLALLAKYLPGMFERGMVYIVDAPEYTAKVGNVRYYGKSVDELEDQAGKQIKDALHIKGWGEVDAAILRELAFNPNTRNLIKIKPISKEDRKKFESLMSEDVEYRRTLLGI